MKYIYTLVCLLFFPFVVSCQSVTHSSVTEEFVPIASPTITQTSTQAPIPTPSYTPTSTPPDWLIRLSATPANTPKVTSTPIPTESLAPLRLAVKNQEELIVFVGRDEQTTSIAMITSNGQKILHLTDAAGNEFSPKWSPDGRYIAYASDRQIPLNEHNQHNYDLWLFDVLNEQSTRLTQGGQMSSYGPSFAWSPTSDKIIFDGTMGVSIVDLNDLSLHVLEEHFSFLFSWSVTNEIAVSDMSFQHPAIHSLAILGADYTPVLPPQEDFFKVGGLFPLNTATSLAWSPNGEQLAIGSFFALRGDSDVKIISIEEDKAVVQASLAENFETIHRNDVADVVWSPDGQWIAFRLVVDDIEQIYVTNSELTELSALTPEDMMCKNPQWSPSSKRLIFSCQGDWEGNADIWIVNRDGSGFQQLTNSPAYEGEPMWQPKP